MRERGVQTKPADCCSYGHVPVHLGPHSPSFVCAGALDASMPTLALTHQCCHYLPLFMHTCICSFMLAECLWHPHACTIILTCPPGLFMCAYMCHHLYIPVPVDSLFAHTLVHAQPHVLVCTGCHLCAPLSMFTHTCIHLCTCPCMPSFTAFSTHSYYCSCYNI